MGLANELQLANGQPQEKLTSELSLQHQTWRFHRFVAPVARQ